jgi:hypothetical protein
LREIRRKPCKLFNIKKYISELMALAQLHPEPVKKIVSSFRLAEVERREKSFANKTQYK